MASSQLLPFFVNKRPEEGIANLADTTCAGLELGETPE
jgi:hypothetical protein